MFLSMVTPPLRQKQMMGDLQGIMNLAVNERKTKKETLEQVEKEELRLERVSPATGACCRERLVKRRLLSYIIVKLCSF